MFGFPPGLKIVGHMWNQGGMILPQLNPVLSYSPCGSSDGSENCYIMQQMDQGPQVCQLYSRKVFVGGLPPDISEGKPFLRLLDINLIPLDNSYCSVELHCWVLKVLIVGTLLISLFKMF